jgi:predicted RNase H-like HicB family nuclease
MKKKKYKLDELLAGINDENIHEEIFTGEDVGREWPKDETDSQLYSRFVKNCPDGKQIISGKEKEDLEEWLNQRSTVAKNATVEGSSEVPSKEEYEKACLRMEELLLITKDVSPEEDPLLAELDKVSDIVYAYEEVHYPIPDLTLKHRGFTGTVDWNDTDGLYYGQVKGIEPDLVSYEGKTLEELEKDFKEALKLYLEGRDEA